MLSVVVWSRQNSVKLVKPGCGGLEVGDVVFAVVKITNIVVAVLPLSAFEVVPMVVVVGMKVVGVVMVNDVVLLVLVVLYERVWVKITPGCEAAALVVINIVVVVITVVLKFVVLLAFVVEVTMVVMVVVVVLMVL